MSADIWGTTEDVALVDLVDRLIGSGVVIGGDIVLSLAGVDLVYVGLRLVLAPAHEVGVLQGPGALRLQAPGALG